MQQSADKLKHFRLFFGGIEADQGDSIKAEGLEVERVSRRPADDEAAGARVEDAEPGIAPVELQPNKRVAAARPLDGHLRGNGGIEQRARVALQAARGGREGACGVPRVAGGAAAVRARSA